MNEIFLKFLETQDFATILAEITGLFIAWQSWVKYKKENKIKRKKIFLNALHGAEQINNLLLELQSELKNVKVIPTVAEITNGGGIPRADKPLYIKAINSTNEEVLTLWGEKTVVVPALTKAIIRLISDDYSYLDIEKFNLKKLEHWAGAKSIQKVHYFVVGYTKRAFVVLAINSESLEELNNEDHLLINTYAVKIKDTYNKYKRFWEEKMI